MNITLNEREKLILRCVVQNFILTANPVGSRIISKKYGLGISPASIRNVMADLEELGLIFHPHTSAGRIPTDKGYRLYVDLLMETPILSKNEIKKLEKELSFEDIERDEIIKSASSLLSKISSQLALVSYPDIIKSVLEKIQLVSLLHNKIMIILNLRSGFIKTITLEIPFELQSDKLDYLENIINERISGLSLETIRKTFQERFKDFTEEKSGVIRLFLNSTEKIFADTSETEKIHFSGVKNILSSPEFKSSENVQGVVELIEDKEIVLHIMDIVKDIHEEKVVVTIGNESKYEKLQDYSLISAQYLSGDTKGIIGIIGPRRLNYSKIIALVDYMSKMLTQVLSKSKN